MKRATKIRDREQGFTLVELMVVVAIIAILAAVTVPSMVRDNAEERYNHFVTQLVRDIQRKRYEAISSKEDRSIAFWSNQYVTRVIESTTDTSTDMLTRTAPEGVVVADVTAESAMPGNGVSPPGGVMGGSEEIRFLGTGGTAWYDSSVPEWVRQTTTIWVKTADDRYKSRVVVFQATSFAALYEGW